MIFFNKKAEYLNPIFLKNSSNPIEISTIFKKQNKK